MLRRPFALPLVVAVVLAAGCIGGQAPGSTSPEPTTPGSTPLPPTSGAPTPTVTLAPTPATVAPQSYPWKPDPLRPGNVEVFVREYERTVRHNELVGPSVIAVEQTCRATLVAEIDAGYFVRAECGGSVHRHEDGTTGGGAVAPERVTYFVNDSTIERIVGGDRRLDPYRADESSRNVASPEGVAVVNADDRRHELRVVIRYDGETGDELVLAESIAVAPGEGVDLQRVAAREGLYNVTVTVGNETVARYRWRVADDELARPGGVGVVVSPDGEVLVVGLARMQ